MYVRALVHDDGAHRAALGAVSAGQTFGLVDFGQSIFVVMHSACGTDFEAGTAAFAILLIDLLFFTGNVRIVRRFHLSGQITHHIVNFRCIGEAEHDGVYTVL